MHKISGPEESYAARQEAGRPGRAANRRAGLNTQLIQSRQEGAKSLVGRSANLLLYLKYLLLHQLNRLWNRFLFYFWRTNLYKPNKKCVKTNGPSLALMLPKDMPHVYLTDPVCVAEAVLQTLLSFIELIN